MDNISGVVAELGERIPLVREMFGSKSSQSIDTCHFLGRQSALSQSQDYVSEWDSRSGCWKPGLSVEQHEKIAKAALLSEGVVHHRLVLCPEWLQDIKLQKTTTIDDKTMNIKEQGLHEIL